MSEPFPPDSLPLLSSLSLSLHRTLRLRTSRTRIISHYSSIVVVVGQTGLSSDLILSALSSVDPRRVMTPLCSPGRKYLNCMHGMERPFARRASVAQSGRCACFWWEGHEDDGGSKCSRLICWAVACKSQPHTAAAGYVSLSSRPPLQRSLPPVDSPQQVL